MRHTGLEVFDATLQRTILSAVEIEDAVRVVVRLLARPTSGGEVAQVYRALPAEVRALWL